MEQNRKPRNKAPMTNLSLTKEAKIYNGEKTVFLTSGSFPGCPAGKESASNAVDLDLIPGLGRSPREGKGYPLQYSGLENSMDCVVHGIAKNQTWLSDFHLNKWCWGNWSSTCKRMKLEHVLTPYVKIKWIKDLNVRPETVKLLEENIGRMPSDINHSKILHDPPPRIMEIKINGTWLNFKSFCTRKETISKVKGSLQNTRK